MFPSVLHEESGIRFVVATPADYQPMVRLLSTSFAHEPMSRTLGVSAGDFVPFVEAFMPECTTNGLSVIAVAAEKGAEPTLAGVLINRDFKAPLPAGIPDAFPWFLPIAQALVTVDAAFEEKHPNQKVGDAMDLWMAAVDVERFARRGIASTLIRLSTELARRRGFARCVTECTGHYSQTAAQRAGFQEVTRLPYGDFRFDGEPVFANVPPPHSHLILYDREC